MVFLKDNQKVIDYCQGVHATVAPSGLSLPCWVGLVVAPSDAMKAKFQGRSFQVRTSECPLDPLSKVHDVLSSVSSTRGNSNNLCNVRGVSRTILTNNSE